jgi:hypothetical protein
LDFAEFKTACVALKPAAEISSDSLAFMYWRALTSRGPSPKARGTSYAEVIRAIKVGEEALLDFGEIRSLCVDALTGAESFLWHCGVFNHLGARKDGTSELLKAREEANRREEVLSIASRLYVTDVRISENSSGVQSARGTAERGAERM